MVQHYKNNDIHTCDRIFKNLKKFIFATETKVFEPNKMLARDSVYKGTICRLHVCNRYAGDFQLDLLHYNILLLRPKGI